jgi:hypothetical protein
MVTKKDRRVNIARQYMKDLGIERAKGKEKVRMSAAAYYAAGYSMKVAKRRAKARVKRKTHRKTRY